MSKQPISPRIRPAGCCQAVKLLTPLPAQESNRYSMLFKALGDRTRLEILRMVSAQDRPLCVCDLVNHFDLSQSTISHHLKTLSDAGVLRMSRRGIWSMCEIDPNAKSLLAAVPKLI
jgi:ArsR family transcriptional regulator